MRVALLPREANSPSSRVRLLQYRPALAEAGVQTRVLAWDVRSRTDVARYAAAALRLARWADVVVLQKPAQPPTLLRAMALANPHLVVDVDDAVWVSGGTGGAAAGSYAERFAEAVRVARGVVAGSEHLAGEVARFGPSDAPVVIRPSVVGADWGVAAAGEGGEIGGGAVVGAGGEGGGGDGTARPAVLGWLGSPQNLRDVHPEVLDALRTVVARGVARVRVVSSRDPAWPGIHAEMVPWTEAGEVAAVRSFDVGLMPLVDDPRSRGRCGFKAIQYLAAGVPVVASPVGAAPEIVGDDERGVLADGAQAWVEALGRLVASADERAALGAAGRRWVATEATVESTVGRWVDVLERVAR